VTKSHSAVCWGLNVAGQLGDGDTTNALTPTPVSGAHAFDSVTVGFEHSCALTIGGYAYCWGTNYNGELGDGTTTNSRTPVLVSGHLAFASVSAGIYHTCGLTTDGVAYCWGNNHNGELGNEAHDVYDNPNPVLVSGGLTFAMLSTGHEYTCGLTPAGAAYCWGRNERGVLGNGSGAQSDVPTPVSGGLTFKSLSVGTLHTCALTASGAAYCWGQGDEGELGTGNTASSSIPVPVTGGIGFATISAGQWATCGVATTGVAYCWGTDNYGQLGRGTTTFNVDPHPTPQPVVGGHTFTSVSVGYLHACGLTTTGALYCWGLPTGTNSSEHTGQSSIPVLVTGQ
jgi:alpha-tubulin suppressor-like RCC1 family protein